MKLSSTEKRFIKISVLFQFMRGKTSEEILEMMKQNIPTADESELKRIIENAEVAYNMPDPNSKTPPQKTDKYNNLYNYVLSNLGTDKIKFETQVSEEEFRTYLYNYPRKYESNNFMGWCDFYDFADKKNEEAHWNYCIARHYYDYGADDYYLPTIPKE